ncbi:28 kDa ribonucleoprotein, chloroplastic-like [Quillaja saponaria]|uniref:28 kDa ribonucleoprotein, chloroplastic-like n=1 Tax=Quillaja saponaria TaxID=32244 RepID=A0AAD7LKH1_QUISA|nr:28 kDa ribonucleoprotein, chloroplastic-like [Quillaja saponaria]
MALLRLLCFPVTSTEHQFHRIPFSPFHQSNCFINNFSLSRSPSSFSFPCLSFTHTHFVRNTETSHFVLKFSSAAQEQAVDSSQVSNASAESQEVKPETEEFSRTRLLASNIPWTCTPEDIRALFEKHGTVLDVELSMYNKTRNRGLAFVTMGSPEEALAALTNLELSEYEGRQLKISYARPRKEKSPPPVQPEPITFNLFVANLSFEARSKHLREFFDSGSGNVVSAEVIFHQAPRRSLGYGFVSFKSKKEAEAALSEFQGKIFMGRPIRVARSRQFVKQPKEESPQSEDTTDELSSDVAEADQADQAS